jgi:hypothetical protein
MNNSDQLMGLVKYGKFMLLTPESDKGKVVSVTEDSMVVGRQIQEIDLGKYEGSAIIGEQAEDPLPSGGGMNAVTPPANRYLYPVRSAYYHR